MPFPKQTATTSTPAGSANGSGNANGSPAPNAKPPECSRQSKSTVRARGAISAAAKRLENESACFAKQPIEIVNLVQGSQEWFALRRQKRTASETPIVMGLSPWQSAEKLAQCKFADHTPESATNKFTKHGHDFESAARAFYEAITDAKFSPCTVMRGHYLASLDGWSEDRRVILEIKCPFTRKNGDTWQSCLRWKIPDHYYAQVQHQLMVTGADCCHFVAFDPDDAQMLRVKAYPDRDFYKKIMAAWHDFEKIYKPKPISKEFGLSIFAAA